MFQEKKKNTQLCRTELQQLYNHCINVRFNVMDLYERSSIVCIIVLGVPEDE